MDTEETNTENAHSLGCLGVGSLIIGALFGFFSLISIPRLIMGCISLLAGNTDDPFGAAHIQDEQVRAYYSIIAVFMPIICGGIAVFLIKFGLWQSQQTEENRLNPTEGDHSK